MHDWLSQVPCELMCPSSTFQGADLLQLGILASQACGAPLVCQATM